MTLGIDDATRAAVRDLVRAKNSPFRAPETDRFVEHFRGIFGRSLRAVIFYGSCISSVTRSTSSMFDFFLVCDRYESFYGNAGGRWRKKKRWVHAALNRFLAPNIYEVEVPAGAALGGGVLRCKFCVVSERHLRRETSWEGHDLYHMGRFSKRMGLAWTASPAVHERVIERFVDAAVTVAGLALGRLAERPDPRAPFTPAEFARAVLALSYEGEVRVEASDKVDKIFRSEADHYEEIYGRRILSALRDGSGRRAVEPAGEDGSMRIALPASETALLARTVQRWLARSRRRGKQRWPKYMFLYENWIDYVIDKIERTKGIRLEPSERDKRWWPIFGWKYFFELRRAGLIKSR